MTRPEKITQAIANFLPQVESSIKFLFLNMSFTCQTKKQLQKKVKAIMGSIIQRTKSGTFARHTKPTHKS